MPTDLAGLRPYRTAVFDNRRWQRFAHRPGDIFVCTPPKCGTTWMQTILVSLLFPDGDAPEPVMVLSQWLEAEFNPIEELIARFEAQTHRRVIKTHTPADGIPWFPDAKYVFVARDGRDAFMSMCNHMDRFKKELREGLNARALADGVPPMPDWDGDVHAFFPRWLENAGLLAHVDTFWKLRSEPNLLLVHYADLKADLSGEMRRVADFAGIEVPAAKWPAVVERCTFDAMRARPDEIGTFWNFEGGAQSFLFKGTNGRWRDVLTDAEVAAYRRRATEILPADAGSWLERGRGALGAAD
jgi:aryl sulfotransferase